MNAITLATRAVVLAAGRGERMRRDDGGVALAPDQRAAADVGLKALVPFHGHPYLSYGLSALADAGVHDVCLVVRAGGDPIRAYYTRLHPGRMRIDFAEQVEALGTADALLCAEWWAGREPFLVVNADNVYPAEVVARVAALPGQGLAGFAVAPLIAGGIPVERTGAFALIDTAADGTLRSIREKPGATALERAGEDALVSMTCWRFDASIFEACRSIAPSARGELELPDAVAWAIARGKRFAVARAAAAVLDLTSRADVPRVEAALRNVAVQL
jgi:glucose-1-phosphate thymidylyltransferase